MTRIPLRLFAALALVALTLFAVACGSSDEDSGDSASKTESGTPAKGKKGGTLKQLGASDVDFLDPGQTYYTGGFQVIYATQTPLYIPKPPIGDAEPGLAEGKPEISDDKKSVTVTLKKGIKFASSGQPRDPGQGRQVRLRARVHQERPEPVHDVLQLHRGRPEPSQVP